MNKMAVPVGVENFERIIKDGYYYVDKSLLIEKLKYLMEDKKRIKNNRNKKSKLIIGGISDYTRKAFLNRLEEKKPGLLLK